MLTALKGRGLDPIFLLAPTSGIERVRTVTRAASGFIYYVSLRGVTGASHLDMAEVTAKIKSIRKHTELPVGVGFGIRGPEGAAEVAKVADAVVVGSAIVSRIEADATTPEKILTDVPQFVTSLRTAMDKPQSATVELAQ